MKTMINVLLIAALAATPVARASEAPVRQWLAEINRDIWAPYMEGVKGDDEDRYLTVHSRDYVRVQADSDFILSYPDYVDDTKTMMANYRRKGVRIAIELRFEERIVNGQSASEKGISRVLFQNADGKTDTYYGRFHAISRREQGRWRVLTEYFAPGDGVGEAQFLRARPVEDLGAFRCYMPFPEKKRRCDGD